MNSDEWTGFWIWVFIFVVLWLAWLNEKTFY